jgi:hypothetical protein
LNQKGSNRRMKRTAYEELHNVYASKTVTRVTAYRRMRWAEHVTRMEKIRTS